jgi:hypothetical protein
MLKRIADDIAANGSATEKKLIVEHQDSSMIDAFLQSGISADSQMEVYGRVATQEEAELMTKQMRDMMRKIAKLSDARDIAGLMKISDEMNRIFSPRNN